MAPSGEQGPVEYICESSNETTAQQRRQQKAQDRVVARAAASSQAGIGEGTVVVIQQVAPSGEQGPVQY